MYAKLTRLRLTLAAALVVGGVAAPLAYAMTFRLGGRARLGALVTVVLGGALLTGLALAAPGKLDPGFGTRGIVSTATAPGAGDDFQDGLAIQRDRRILVAGSSDVGTGEFQWRIARYTHKGALDASFGSGGTVLTPMGSPSGSFEQHIWDLALQPDGKIVAAGRAVTPTGGGDIALARYLPNGQLDGSFGNGGKVFTAIGPGTNPDEALSAVLDASGRIVVAGFARTGTGVSGNDFALARYLPGGTLDSSFNPGGTRPGIVVIDIAGNRDQFNDVTIDASARIVAAGSARVGTRSDFAVARFLPDGTLDSSFNPAGPIPGIVITPMSPGDNPDAAISMAIDAGGGIVAGGFSDTGGFIDLALARYNPDGSLDTTFGTGGKVLTNVGPGNTAEDLEELVIQPTGKILVGGSSAATEFYVDSDFMLARYKPDGSLDGSFGTGGIVVTRTAPGNADDEIFAIGLQQDAKLVAAGECVQPSTGRDVCVVRYKVGEAD